jgi:muconolactone delta-isomerase
MGVKSTYRIKKDIAIQVIISNLFKMDNEALANMLESLPQSTYRNYQVFDWDDGGEEERTINDVNEFEYK